MNSFDRIDTYNNNITVYENKRIFLCTPGLKKINVLNGLDPTSVNLSVQVKGYSELQFKVDRYVSVRGKRVVSNCYDMLKPYMYIYLEDIGYFIMEPPTVNFDDRNVESKDIVAYSAEREFEDKDWKGIKINCGTSDSMEYSNTTYTIDDVSNSSDIKANVSKFGGNVSGVLRFSIMWNDGLEWNKNDEDAHCITPSNNRISYGRRTDVETGGTLDVDIINPKKDSPGIENIYWASKDTMVDGTYQFYVKTYSWRGGTDGFKAEIEFDNKIYYYHYNKSTESQKETPIANVTLSNGKFTIEHLINVTSVNGVSYYEEEEKEENTILNYNVIDGFAVNYVTMVNNKDINLSFLHQILKKMSSRWKIGEMSDYVANLKIPAIEIDNSNLYAVMTNDVAPRLDCIFVFDYLNFTINVYHKNDVDFDTGIFISFRNLENSVSITADQNSIYTRFTVKGDGNLELRHWNFGEEKIINLDYFAEEPYMDTTLSDRYNAWKEYRDKYRETYKELSLQRDEYLERRDEVIYAVPSDASYWKNWNSMNEEGLNENLDYYNALLESFQIACDPRAQNLKYDEDGNYKPVLDSEGEVDHEYYLEILYENMGIYSGYYTYREIITYIIPNIELAISNLGLVDKLEPVSLVNEDWDLFGLEEIKGVLASYEDKLKALEKYSKSWEDMTPEERKQEGLDFVDDGTGTSYESCPGRKEYLHYYSEIGDDDTEGTIKYRIKQLKIELKEIENHIVSLGKQIHFYSTLAKYDLTKREYNSLYVYDQDAFDDRLNNVGFFTEEELVVFESLLKDTDYTNSNILATSILSVSEKYDCEKELYDDAVDKLIEVSQPQLKFSVDMDNFLRLPEYESWAEEFSPQSSATMGMLKFIRVAVRDDYVTKLRVVGYNWNPCEVTPDFEIQFSNMITGRSGRSDLTELFNSENNRGSKNSISIGNGSAESEQEYIMALMRLLKKNSVFTRSVSDVASNTTGGVDESVVNRIISDYLNNMHINVHSISGDTGDFNTLFSNYLSAKTIVAKFAEMDEANIKSITSNLITVQGEGSLTQITGDMISTTKINASNITGEVGDFQTLLAGVLDAAIANVGELHADVGKFNEFFAEYIEAENGNFKQLIADNIVAEKITAQYISAKLAEFDEESVNTLFANTIFAGKISASFTDSLQSTTTNSYITNLVTKNVKVSDLKAGNITLSKDMKIISDANAMVMDSSGFTIYGKNENDELYPSIAIGYDNDNNPSIIISDSKGSIMLDSQGLKEEAVVDNLIKDRMIADNTISQSKLGFTVMVPNEYGGVDIKDIYDGEENFGADYTSFKNRKVGGVQLIKNSKTLIDPLIYWLGEDTGMNLIRNTETLTDAYITWK